MRGKQTLSRSQCGQYIFYTTDHITNLFAILLALRNPSRQGPQPLCILPPTRNVLINTRVRPDASECAGSNSVASQIRLWNGDGVPADAAALVLLSCSSKNGIQSLRLLHRGIWVLLWCSGNVAVTLETDDQYRTWHLISVIHIRMMPNV